MCTAFPTRSRLQQTPETTDGKLLLICCFSPMAFASQLLPNFLLHEIVFLSYV